MCVEPGELGDTRKVTTFAWRRVEPRFKSVKGDGRADEPRAKTENIGVVVLARETRRSGVVRERGAHAGHLVRRDRDTDARSAHRDAQVRVSLDNCTTHRFAKVRVINRIRGIGGADVDNLVTPSFECGDQERLEVVPRVIRSKGDAH